MLSLSVDQGQFLTGIISQYGMKGMWFVWSGWIGIFVIPIVFAPLWQKLNFITDNQFMLFRYPGKSGKIVHLFRALYVGIFVVSLSLCFHVLGFSRVIQIYFEIDETTSIIVTGLILTLYSLKNIIAIKLKTDTFHAFLYFCGVLVILISIWYASDGWNGFYSFFEKNPDKKAIIPTKSDINSWFSLIVFLGVQWWSCYLFDGGGPEMSRYTAVNTKKNAIMTGLLPIIISFILSFFILGHIIFILGLNPNNNSEEIFYVKNIFKVVPQGFKPLVFLGFFGMFISLAESLLNWGAAFLTMDAYKQYLNPKASPYNIQILSIGIMITLSLLSLVFALQINSLESLVKITFSIAAGVAPVYILRWVWYRINAWSQLSAMLSSALFTLIYPNIHELMPLSKYPMEESRVIVVTILTTIIWLLFTFLIKNQSIEVQKKMQPIIESSAIFFKRFIISIGLGICFLVLITMIWWKILE